MGRRRHPARRQRPTAAAKLRRLVERCSSTDASAERTRGRAGGERRHRAARQPAARTRAGVGRGGDRARLAALPERARRPRAAVVAIEDLHWAEPALLDMVEPLVARSTGPLLVVATARPEFAETRPELGPAPGHVADRARAARPQAHRASWSRTASGRRRGAARPGRRPRPRATRSSPRRSCATSSATAARSRATIPTTVRALLAARIDALPEAEKQRAPGRRGGRPRVLGRARWSRGGTAPSRWRALRALEERGSS